MKTEIILISGKQGSGKTTLGQSLVRAAYGQGYFAQVFKFAGPLYRIHDAVLETAENLLGVPKVTKDGDLLQLLGTEWARKKFGPDVWANALQKQITNAREMIPPSFKLLAIVDDCRFQNEFDAFPEALSVRLEISEDIRRARAESWRENTLHPSETGLDAYSKNGIFSIYLWGGRTPEDCATYILNKLEQRRKESFDLWGNRK